MMQSSLPKARFGLLVGIACSLTFTSALVAQDEELEEFVVTGSRVARIDLEGPSPVVTLSRDYLDSTGFSTVGDALRTLPYTTGTSLTPIDSGTSFTPGISTFNMRGIGNNNVLVLVNGRRAAPFGSSGFNGFQTMFDLNSLPSSAIESIEILKDGASAIYGSDAVAGVVNVKLRRDYEGMNVTLGFGNTFGTDSFEKRGSVMMGTRSQKTSIMLTADWMERNAIFARDYKLTGNADLRDIGGADRRSSAGWPSSVWINSLGNFYTFPAPTASPTVAAAVPGLTRHNFLANSDLQPEVRYYGFYSFAKHEISDTLAAFAEVSFRRAETLSQSAPTPNFNWNEQGDGPLGEIMIPAANPFNPWNEDIDYWLGRFVLAGNRLNDLTSDTPRILLGLEGKIEPLNMNWELAANYSKSTVVNKNGGAIQDQLLQDALNGIVVGAGTPEQTTLYLNPFGPSDQRVYDYMVIGNPVTSSYEVRGYDFTVNGTLMDLPAGALGYAAGVEYREEELDDRKTALNETAQIVGGSEGSSVMGDREVWSVYAEVVAPVVKMVELQAAARYENYSDFGTTTKPKVAAVFRPLDSLLVRTSYGESFLAPNLPFLYTSQSTSFTSQAIADPKRPQDGLRQVKMLGGGNPNLQPEETKTFFVGLAFEPKAGGLKGFYAGVDFFVFDSDNLIDRFDAEDILDNEDDPAFAPLVVRNPPEAGATIGGLNHVITTWTNVATRKYRGFDVDLRYRFETGSVGTFDLRTSWTYQDEIAFDGTDFAGTRLYPEWRGNILAAWNHGDWAASVFVDYIGSRSGTGQTNAAGQQVTNSRYGSYIRVNPSVSYRGLWDTSITVGVRNVFDKEPPVDYGDNLRYTSSIMNYERAFWYVRLSREF